VAIGDLCTEGFGNSAISAVFQAISAYREYGIRGARSAVSLSRQLCRTFVDRKERRHIGHIAHSANLALTTVSRNEYPKPTCSSNVRNSG
jgi:hypothetical protein